jgi:outer membrane protein OmpA-like peptidoglycan-associated protein
MADPITAAVIVGLAASKFAEGAAGKAAEKLVGELWEAIAARFKDRRKTAENLAAIAATKGADAGAIAKVTVVLDGELVEDEEFAKELQQMAQQIINVQNQSQSQQNNVNYGRDMFVINNPTGEMKLGG